ncbi:hypothetical protein GYA54_00610 [Candidatus Kuenenbacteria bacterium]|nr:hypothetical protein [Candidatus Kuenenbacteria bacterium]
MGFDFKNINKDFFMSQGGWQQLSEEVRRIEDEADHRAANDIYLSMIKIRQDILGMGDVDQRQRYLQLIQELRFWAIPYLKEEELASIAREHLVDYLKINSETGSLKGFFKKRFVDWPYEAVVATKDRLLNVIASNKELLTVGRLGKEMGTVANWVKDYLRFKNDNQGMDQVMLKAQYFFQNDLINRLVKEDKEKVERLIDFYEYLKRRSGEFGGDDGVEIVLIDGETYIANEGKLTKIRVAGGSEQGSGQKKEVEKTAEKMLSQNQELRVKVDNFIKSGLMVKALAIREKLHEQKLEEVKNSRSYFYQAVNALKAEEAVAALFLLAENGKLKEAFAGDERFVKFWSDYLVKNNLDKSGFDKDPANGRDLARFLKYILEGRLKMKPEEAAMLGILTANLAREAGELVYKALAYGDMETGEFRWNI